jgi:hypothetical protein
MAIGTRQDTWFGVYAAKRQQKHAPAAETSARETILRFLHVRSVSASPASARVCSRVERREPGAFLGAVVPSGIVTAPERAIPRPETSARARADRFVTVAHSFRPAPLFCHGTRAAGRGFGTWSARAAYPSTIVLPKHSAQRREAAAVASAPRFCHVPAAQERSFSPSAVTNLWPAAVDGTMAHSFAQESTNCLGAAQLGAAPDRAP